MEILVSGATGNVGGALIKQLLKNESKFSVVAGTRDGSYNDTHNDNIKAVKFDFEQPQTIESALENCKILFLLRPPQIADTEKYFKPLVETAKQKGVSHIIFLSVQGAESNSIIPHHKIEQLIVESKIPYTFLRPAYFMQNFTGTFLKDIKEKKEVYIPAGNSKFTIVDVNDIARFTVAILKDLKTHVNKAYALTNNELLDFKEMTETISKVSGIQLRYKSPNLLAFFIRKKRQGVPSMLIFVMIMLHYFPRFKKTPARTEWIKKITGNDPLSFQEFISLNKEVFTS